MQTINDDLKVTGKLIVEGGEIQVNGPVRIMVNNQGAITALDGYGTEINLLNVDPWGTITLGPGSQGHLKNRIERYVPEEVDSRKVLWEGWQGAPSAGMALTTIGGGYGLTYPGTGAMRFETGATAGDGVRIDFGKLFTTTDRRTALWGMFNTETNADIDLQFGLMATYGPAIYLRYSSTGASTEWKCQSNDGNGNISTKIFTGINDSTFRRQFQIFLPNAYGGGGPSEVSFLLGDLNNEFTLRQDHSPLLGSLPGVTEKLYPYLQFRTNANAAKVLQFDHVWGSFER